MQRTNHPPSLDLESLPVHSSYKDSPPLTPPNRIRTKGNRASKVHKARPTPRETYIQTAARGACGNEQFPNERISHDLSLSDNPRHSVVDNMLLSLNPDQPRLSSPISTKLPRSAGSKLSSTKSLRHRGHLPSSSSASDTTYAIDESPSRFSSHFTRGRRSNSSSNFQSTLGRIDSARPSDDHGPTRRSNALIAQRAGAVDRSSVPSTRAGRKSSKSSGSSSVDLGRMAGGTKWNQSLSRRSSSFDHGHRPHFSSEFNSSATLPKSSSQPLYRPSTEIAPTPIVPGGPRTRDASPAKGARTAHLRPQPPPLNRKGSTGSLRGANKLKKNKGDTTDNNGTRSGRSKSPEKRQGPENAQPPQSYISSGTGSKVVSRAVSPSRVQSEPSLSLAPEKSGTPRERPGFFKRVFGSSRNNYHANELRHPQPPASMRNSIRADSRTGFAVPDALQTPNHGDDTSASKPLHPTVVKKPSSFFRRRKKSISETNPTLIAPLELPASLSNSAAEKSPGLRQVMDPFLRSPLSNQSDGIRPHDVAGSEGTYVPLSSTPHRPSLNHVSSSLRFKTSTIRSSSQTHPAHWHHVLGKTLMLVATLIQTTHLSTHQSILSSMTIVVVKIKVSMLIKITSPLGRAILCPPIAQQVASPLMLLPRRMATLVYEAPSWGLRIDDQSCREAQRRWGSIALILYIPHPTVHVEKQQRKIGLELSIPHPQTTNPHHQALQRDQIVFGCSLRSLTRIFPAPATYRYQLKVPR